MVYFQEQAPQKIAILRPLQFGDLMCAVPAFRALRAAFPQAEVSLIGLPGSSAFVRRFHHYLDHLLEFPGFPGFPEQLPRIEALPGFLIQTQGEHFDLALQMQGSGNLSNSIIALLGAKRTAGFYLEGSYRPDDTTFFDYPVSEHEIWRNLRLMEHLDIPLQGDALEFPVYDEDWQDFNTLQETYGLIHNEYIVIHAGARARERRWAPEKFAAVADAISYFGFRIVLTGMEEEAPITRNVAAHANASVIDLTGRTNYGTMAALLLNSRMLVCNDTGVSHLASALQVPSVVLFSASEPERWAPLNQTLHRPVLWASAATPMVVIHEIEKLLQEERLYAS